MDDRRKFRLLGAAIAIALFAVVFAVPGRAANDASEVRSVSQFDRIRLESAFTASITAGGNQRHVVVRASPDAIDRITTEVHDRTLAIGMRSGDISLWRAPRVEIAVPVLRSIRNEGAGSIAIRGLTGDDIAIEVSGASSVVASGRAAHETIVLSGTGRVDTTGVEAHDVSVENNGVGSVHVRASGVLTMNINGVGEIRYAGEPTHVESHINGIGRIGRL